MKKIILIFVMMLAIASVAMAAGLSKNLQQNSSPVQIFTPDAGYTQTVTPGTKGTASATVIGYSAVQFYCYGNGTVTPVIVKQGINGSTTNYNPVSNGTIGINNSANGTKTTSVTFTSMSTATVVKCTVFAQ